MRQNQPPEKPFFKGGKLPTEVTFAFPADANLPLEALEPRKLRIPVTDCPTSTGALEAAENKNNPLWIRKRVLETPIHLYFGFFGGNLEATLRTPIFIILMGLNLGVEFRRRIRLLLRVFG